MRKPLAWTSMVTRMMLAASCESVRWEIELSVAHLMLGKPLIHILLQQLLGNNRRHAMGCVSHRTISLA